MAEFFDYDPLTGVRKDWEYDEETGVATIRTTQELSGLIDLNTEIRNTGQADSTLKRDNYFCKYATIPPVIVLELKKKGIDVMGKTDTKKLMQVIDRDYPYLKTTYLKHA